MHPQMILSSTPDMDCISSTIWRRHTLPYTFLNTWASECNHEGVCHVMIETWMILYLSIYEYRTVDTHHDHDIYIYIKIKYTCVFAVQFGMLTQVAGRVKVRKVGHPWFIPWWGCAQEGVMDSNCKDFRISWSFWSILLQEGGVSLKRFWAKKRS